ncbi:MAG: DUF898 family protein [Gammaproteobacteria bacterium]|nr:DUF898 family protein [Gammaproteobacteria bacterium]
MNQSARDTHTHGLDSQSGYLDFLPTVIVNTLAVILTFNVFIFWAKSNVRSYLWRTTYLHGFPLHYSGEGRELALGFAVTSALFLLLFAYPLLILINAANFDPEWLNPTDMGWVGSLILAVIVPVLLSLVGMILLFAPEIDTSPFSIGVSAFVLWIAITFFMTLSRFLTYRYLFRHTHWRDGDGGVAGSPWKYAFKMLLPEMSVLLTAGWSGPWRFVRRFDLILNSAMFAGSAFEFNGNARKLYGPFAIAWVSGVALTAAYIAMSNLVDSDAGVFFGIYVTVLTLGWFAGYVLVSAFYSARVFAHIAESTSLGDVRFRFNATYMEIAQLFFTNLVMNLLSAGFSYYYSRMRIARFIVRHLEIRGEIVAHASDAGDEENELPEGIFGEGIEILVAGSYF